MFSRKSLILLAALLTLGLIGLACAPTQAPGPVIQTGVPVVQTVVQTVVAPLVQTVVSVQTSAPQLQVVTATPPPAAAKTITVIANWGGAEREAFQKVIDGFTAKTGIKVNYEQSRNLEALVRTRVAGGNPPDIAFEPRPGALAEFARAGNLVPLDQPVGKEVVDPKALSAAYGAAFTDLGSVDGVLYGLMFKANSKSTFWYKPPSFKSLGVNPPANWTDLIAIADKYKAAGKTPFAVGGKDGWVLTDYFENIYARVATPKMYNDLHVTHKVAWTDPSVKKALGLMAQLLGTPGYVAGGGQGALGTGFTDSIAQVFGKSPSAEMFYEGGFVGVLVKDANASLVPGTDIDFFPFPQIDAQFDDPVIGGGDFAVMFKDSPEGRAMMAYLATKEAAEIFAKTGSVSPSKLIDPAVYTSSLAKKEYQQVSAAKTFLFDGSDLAPSSLGGDFEFTKLQDLVTHPADVDRIATELENFAKTAY